MERWIVRGTRLQCMMIVIELEDEAKQGRQQKNALHKNVKDNQAKWKAMMGADSDARAEVRAE